MRLTHPYLGHKRTRGLGGFAASVTGPGEPLHPPRQVLTPEPSHLSVQNMILSTVIYLSEFIQSSSGEIHTPSNEWH